MDTAGHRQFSGAHCARGGRGGRSASLSALILMGDRCDSLERVNTTRTENWDARQQSRLVRSTRGETRARRGSPARRARRMLFPLTGAFEMGDPRFFLSFLSVPLFLSAPAGPVGMFDSARPMHWAIYSLQNTGQSGQASWRDHSRGVEIVDKFRGGHPASLASACASRQENRSFFNQLCTRSRPSFSWHMNC